MNKTSATLLLWSPRVAGILVACFLGLFAIDAFEHQPVVAALPDFAIHLIPSLLVFAAVAIAWKFEWIGAVAFLGLAIAYVLMVPRRLDWIAVVSGPLAVVGALFLISWRRHGQLTSPR